MLYNDNPSLATLDFPHEIQTLLIKFDVLFQPPQTLPPTKATYHHIHLLPQSVPVNVCPYRYLHFQKHDIELQVEMML